MPKGKKTKDKIEDEPGAEQRFSTILKRALNTPPKRKQGASERSPDLGQTRKKK